MFIKSRILTVLDCIPVVACLLCIRYLEKTFYPGHFSSGKAAAVTLILVFLMAFLYYLAAFTEELGSPALRAFNGLQVFVLLLRSVHTRKAKGKAAPVPHIIQKAQLHHGAAAHGKRTFPV